MPEHYAHSLSNADPDKWHGLADHLEETAVIAAAIATKWNATEWGRAAALLHDIGKYSEAFQLRVRGAPVALDHATAGANLALDEYDKRGKLLAYAVAGHHGGMPDGSGAHDATQMALGDTNVGSRPTNIAGVDVPTGTGVTLCIGAANRDPDQFPDPDRLDLARKPNRHLAFGSGPHTCAGLSLARLEGRIAIGELVRRFPKFALRGAAVRGNRLRFRGFLSLPARLS